MVTKKRVDGGARVKVIFTLPAVEERVAGDFNDWDAAATPRRKRGDTRSASVSLAAGQRHSFR